MNTPLVWAHRGASGYAPENTLPAFKLAAEMKADGVELDVQLTKDGEVIVCHDERIDRTSNGHGPIGSMTLAELKEFDFCNHNYVYEGTRIPTMREVFELLEPTGLTINIELKTGIVFYKDLEEKTVRLTQEYGMQDRVIYSSFNHYSILKIQELDPQAQTAFLYSDGTYDMPGYGAAHHVTALHPHIANLQYPHYMEDCAARGLDVNVWTVNTEKDLLYCLDMGVHAVITNYPAKAVELFGRKE